MGELTLFSVRSWMTIFQLEQKKKKYYPTYCSQYYVQFHILILLPQHSYHMIPSMATFDDVCENHNPISLLTRLLMMDLCAMHTQRKDSVVYKIHTRGTDSTGWVWVYMLSMLRGTVTKRAAYLLCSSPYMHLHVHTHTQGGGGGGCVCVCPPFFTLLVTFLCIQETCA